MSDDANVALSIGFGILALMVLVAFSLMLRHRRREIQHREWMAALEKGVPLPDLNGLEMSMGGPRSYLLKGLIWLACGLTLTAFLIGVWLTTGNQVPVDERIRQARELGYTQEQIREMAVLWAPQRMGFFPFGLTLIGLVPAGIGVAYLVVYRLETRQRRQVK